MAPETREILAGIDIGASKTRMAIYQNGKLVPFFHQPTPQDPEIFISMVSAALHRSVSDLSGIGIGCPGPLDQERGLVLSPPNLPQWDRFPVADRLEREFGVPVFLENDGNAGALGEALFGSARDCRRVFYMTISTGLGTGIVIDRRVYRGAHGLAGEIWAFDPGHFPNSGRNVILNELASGTGMVLQARHYLEQGEESSVTAGVRDSRTVLEAAEQGDALAVRIVKETRETLGTTLLFVLYLLDPDVIVLGGGLCTQPHRIVDPVLELVRQRLRIPTQACYTAHRPQLLRVDFPTQGAPHGFGHHHSRRHQH